MDRRTRERLEGYIEDSALRHLEISRASGGGGLVAALGIT